MSTNRRETVTITSLTGDSERVTLPRPHYENPKGHRSEDTTGTWWEALYVGPRTGRMFVRMYSIWDDGNGRCVGTTYSELSMADYLWFCERIGCSPVGQAATGSEA
jgi:hypothetical protein